MHVIIVDNGRSANLGNNKYRNALKCIRCGACLNTCPVYRRSGGHSYDYTIPGPIGSILASGINMKKYKDLPYASSLCGSCTNICPVKIDIHNQLYHLRQEIVEKRIISPVKRLILAIAGKILSRNTVYNSAGKLIRWTIRNIPRKLVYNSFNAWGRDREFPVVPHESFKQWYKKNYPVQKIENEQR